MTRTICTCLSLKCFLVPTTTEYTIIRVKITDEVHFNYIFNYNSMTKYNILPTHLYHKCLFYEALKKCNKQILETELCDVKYVDWDNF